MFEYHGWITVRATPEAVDDEPPLRLAEIREVVDRLAGYALVDLRYMNGELCIHLGGHPNRRGGQGRAVRALFDEVGRLAPGSYGLLYELDDEDPGFENTWRVIRLVRGAVTEHADLFLSPAIPTLEDETGRDPKVV